jgi:hypothetical protein
MLAFSEPAALAQASPYHGRMIFTVPIVSGVRNIACQAQVTEELLPRSIPMKLTVWDGNFS